MSRADKTHTIEVRIAALTAFLDAFEAPGFSFGKMRCDPGVMPYYVFSEEASRFHKCAYEYGWVLSDFDWTAWDEGRRFVDDPQALESASLEDIERFLTAHLRQERFCEGHLGTMFEIERAHV